MLHVGKKKLGQREWGSQVSGHDLVFLKFTLYVFFCLKVIDLVSGICQVTYLIVLLFFLAFALDWYFYYYRYHYHKKLRCMASSCGAGLLQFVCIVPFKLYKPLGPVWMLIPFCSWCTTVKNKARHWSFGSVCCQSCDLDHSTGTF